MFDENMNIRYLIIIYSIRYGNVSETCRLFGISRTTYYKWYERYKKFGIEGLKDAEKKKPNMPNKISKEIEKIILDLVIERPKDGPRRLSYDLNDMGIDISETGVYNVLKRNGLNRTKDRIKFARENEYLYSHKTRKNKLPNYKEVEKYYPGYVLQLGTSYIGKVDNIGKVYMVSIVDCYSNFAVAKVYNDKSFASVKDLIDTKLIPIMKNFHIDVENIITNGSREYTTNWEGGKHKFKTLLNEYNIKHHIIPASESTGPKYLQYLNDILYEDFYKEVLIRNRYPSLEKLQGDLQLYMAYYNLDRKIGKGRNIGKTPIESVGKVEINLPMPAWFFINSSSLDEL
ncbi:helix-turn-helix domain-containing protein [Bacteroidales bacterium MSK.15.36]|nr:helix-turn-helix domain-containing protein [Bacteroidales bacterium MSK.15.36]